MSIRRITHCVVLCALYFVASMVAHAQPVARPDLRIGDTWTVKISMNTGIGGAGGREEVRVVKEAGETGYQLENTQKGGGAAVAPEMLVVSRDLNFISQTTGVPQEFKWLQWPLEPGRTYQFESNFQNVTSTWKGKVTGWEEVEVPAGKFKALHVEFERSGPFRGSASESLWYAPEAKAVVKRIQMRPGIQGSRDITTFELVAYKLS
jgi:hypothetical protein